MIYEEKGVNNGKQKERGVVIGFKLRVATINFYPREGNIPNKPNLIRDSKLLTRFRRRECVRHPSSTLFTRILGLEAHF